MLIQSAANQHGYPKCIPLDVERCPGTNYCQLANVGSSRLFPPLRRGCLSNPIALGFPFAQPIHRFPSLLLRRTTWRIRIVATWVGAAYALYFRPLSIYVPRFKSCLTHLVSWHFKCTLFVRVLGQLRATQIIKVFCILLYALLVFMFAI